MIPDRQPYFTTVAEEISNRPRRRLDYLSPTEFFDRLLAVEAHVAFNALSPSERSKRMARAM